MPRQNTVLNMDTTDQETPAALKMLGKFAFSTLLTTGGLFVLRLLKNVLFTRLLGPSGRGVYSFLTTVPDLVVSVGNLGFGLGNVYLLAQKKAPLQKIIANAAGYLLFNGILLMVAGFMLLSHEWIFNSQALLTTDLRMVIVIAIGLMLAYHLGMDLLTGIKDIHFMNGLRLLFSALPIVLLLLFWAVFHNALWAAIGAWLCTIITVVAAVGWRLFRILPEPPQINLPLFGQALFFGLRGNVSMFANAVVRRVDILFIAYFYDAEAVGLYTAGVSVAEILLALPDAVALPFLPIRLEMKHSDAGFFSSFTIKYVLFFMAGACLATAIFSKLIIMILFGNQFLQSTAPLLWLLPGIAALSIYPFLKADMYSLNRPGLISWVSVFTMVCNLVLNYLTIPAYGIAGAAASSSISYILSTGLLLLLYLKKSGQRPSDVLILKKAEFVLIFGNIRSSLQEGRRREGK